MKNLILILCLVLFTGCCKKPVQTTYIERDSIRTEYITEYREVIRDSLIYIPVPVESHVKEGLRDSSHLETSVAESDAWIDPDGRLGHSIRNKDVFLSAVAKIKDSYRIDTLIRTEYKYIDRSETIVKKHIPAFFWGCFGIVLGLFLFGVVWVIKKIKVI